MAQKKLKISQLPPFVALKTTYDFKQVALRLAKVKKAVGAFRKVDPEMIADGAVNIAALMAFSSKETDEAIAILRSIRKRVQKYSKEL